MVFGTDGISDAYASIRAGELTGTVDSLPGADRRSRVWRRRCASSQGALPRVVATPQALITKDNVERYAVKGVDVRAVLDEPAESGHKRTRLPESRQPLLPLLDGDPHG